MHPNVSPQVLPVLSYPVSMPKIKPKAILARVILGEGWKERNNSDYLLCAGHERRLTVWNDDSDDIDDGSSIISTSTTATADNQPGTGRFLDTYILQPTGRCIERLAMRFTIASLHPARIAQYIEASPPGRPDFHRCTLNNAIAWLCSVRRNGSTIVAGMKGLVKQTQYAPETYPRKEGIHSTFLGQTHSTNPHWHLQHSFVWPRTCTVAVSTSTFLASSPYSTWKHSLYLSLAHIQTRNGFFCW